jgi:Tfp pilus assembly protein PilF
MLLSLTAAGCAGKSPWDSFSSKPDLPPPASVGAESKNPLAKLVDYKSDDQHQFAQPSVKTPAPSGSSGGVTGALGAAVAKTKQALTIEPKVEHAPDPLSLASGPVEVGPELHFASARVHESQGNINRADELYRQALAAAPGDLTILVHYARMHDRAGNLGRAAEIYRQAIAAHPQEAAAYNDLGLCLARQERVTESVDCLQQAVKLHGESVLYRNNLATVLAELGRYDEALTHLNAVHAPAAANYNLGYLLHKSGKGALAATYLRRAVQLDPQMAPAHQLLAVVTAPAGQVAARPQAPAGGDPRASDDGQNVFISISDPHSPPGPASLPAVKAPQQDWGDAPSPGDLPQLLPPVR